MGKKNYPLIELLLSLKDSDNRAKLAALRRGASDPFSNFAALSVIGWAINDPRDFKNAMLISTLFAVHPRHTDNQNIGDAFRMVRNSLTVGQESLDTRFTLLLRCDYEDLPHQLLQACRFLANKEIGIDYFQLYDDLRYWNRTDKSVQLNWAKSYWVKPKTNENQKENLNSNFINNNQEN